MQRLLLRLQLRAINLLDKIEELGTYVTSAAEDPRYVMNQEAATDAAEEISNLASILTLDTIELKDTWEDRS
jgi:hypothetical protein